MTEIRTTEQLFEEWCELKGISTMVKVRWMRYLSNKQWDEVDCLQGIASTLLDHIKDDDT